MKYERRGECLGCGNNCCTLSGIPVAFDRERHADYILWLSYHGIEIKDVPDVGQFAIIRAPCKYLTLEGKCAVFGKPERPQMCNKWPQLPWELGLMDEKGQRECGYSFVALTELEETKT